MSHALFSPSAAHRWMECPGSFAFPGNTEDGESSIYADDGTASHHWGALCLMNDKAAYAYIGDTLELNGRTYTMDEERADFVQTYINTVQLLSTGAHLLIEYRVDLSRWLGPEQGGTADAAIFTEDEVCIVDLKYGMGEKVDAAYMVNGKRKPNHQLGLYAAGLIQDAELLGYTPKRARLVVSQPRLGHHSEEVFEIGEIIEHAVRAKSASELAGTALVLAEDSPEAQALMHPGEKQCRWCCAKARCVKLQAAVVEETRCDFDDLSQGVAAPPVQLDKLSKAAQAVGLVMMWAGAVIDEVKVRIGEGDEVIGSDGLPMKFVEGKMGKRVWKDPKAAEAALVGLMGPAAYAPQTIITAAKAHQKWNKKKTEATYNDIISPLITRAAGKPQLALGSDERAPYSGAATGSDFDTEDEE